MKFDYKLYPSHNWTVIVDEYDLNKSFQVYCDKCNSRVTTTTTVGDPYSDITGFIVIGHYNKQYGKQWFLPPLEDINKFFETYSCDELIIKNIIE
jgi:hypothetical protein